MLTSDSTLYCVTVNKDTVKWSYVDLADIRSTLTSSTDAITGVSNIQVLTTEPGFYTCEVIVNGRCNAMYTVGILNTELYTGIWIYFKYHYTVDPAIIRHSLGNEKMSDYQIVGISSNLCKVM